MSNIKRECLAFYLMGRHERIVRGWDDIDEEKIVDTVMNKQDSVAIRDTVLTEVTRLAPGILTGRVKTKWLSEHADDIVRRGVNAEEAYQAWCDGRLDEVVDATESAVIDMLSSQVLDED